MGMFIIFLPKSEKVKQKTKEKLEKNVQVLWQEALRYRWGQHIAAVKLPRHFPFVLMEKPVRVRSGEELSMWLGVLFGEGGLGAALQPHFDIGGGRMGGGLWSSKRAVQLVL